MVRRRLVHGSQGTHVRAAAGTGYIVSSAHRDPAQLQRLVVLLGELVAMGVPSPTGDSGACYPEPSAVLHLEMRPVDCQLPE